jgi:hypothetical protein
VWPFFPAKQALLLSISYVPTLNYKFDHHNNRAGLQRLGLLYPYAAAPIIDKTLADFQKLPPRFKLVFMPRDFRAVFGVSLAFAATSEL